MRRLLITLLLVTNNLMAQYQPDILGTNFEQRTLEMECDYSGEVCATLVRRTPLVDSDHAILYVHGYNDYFFQREMADRFHDSLYNFYAIDLRKYGRSLRPFQTPFEVRDMSEYFADIDAALEVMSEDGIRHVTIMAHSTGGLTTALYCHERRSNSMIDGLILNSPFFDMNLGWGLETFGIPVVSFIGGFSPNLIILRDSSSAYFKSLLKEYHGEWSYDTDWKKSVAEPTTAGWVRAIHTAQQELQAGLDIEVPVLVMYSDKSMLSSEWCEGCQSHDIVLDVEDIALYSPKIGRRVTQVEIEDGMHDLVLSRRDVREQVYRTMFGWLRSNNLN